MREVLSLFLFGIGALFFVVFLTALKPDSVTAAAGSNKPGYWSRLAARGSSLEGAGLTFAR
jgi:hypothetical protein